MERQQHDHHDLAQEGVLTLGRARRAAFRGLDLSWAHRVEGRRLLDLGHSGRSEGEAG